MNSVLLVTVDCLRPDHVHAYGYERETTPNIDRLAADGTVFERAYSNGPGTRWAFRALNMGVYPLRVAGAGLPRSAGTTLAELLSSEGYRTGAFADNPFLTGHFNHDRGFETFRDTEYWSEQTSASASAFDRLNELATAVSNRLPEGRLYRTLRRAYTRFVRSAESTAGGSLSSDPEVVDTALSWIADAEAADDPYFAWVHLMDAHHPHQYHADHREALGIPEDSDHLRIPGNVVEPGGDPPRAVVDTYDANLREADSHVGRLLAGVDDDTTVVLTGDHGEEFGRHNQFHSASVYENMARVPLVVRGPEFEDTHLAEAVNHVDVPVTIARQAAGVEPPELWDGMALNSTEPPSRDIFLGIEWPDQIAGAVVRDRWKYRCRLADFDTTEAEFLHDLTADPHEAGDGHGENPERLGTLRGAWRDHVASVCSNRLTSEHPTWDPADDQSPEDVVGEESRTEASEQIEERLEHLGYK